MALHLRVYVYAVAVCAANAIAGVHYAEADRCLRDYAINLRY